MAQSRIGQAYLQVVPVIGDFTDQLKKQFDKSMDEVSKEAPGGTEFGEAFGDKAGKGASNKLGTQIMAGLAALGIGNFLADQINKGLDQIDTGNKVQAALNLTEEQNKEMTEAISNLYANAYGESHEAVAESMKNIVSSIKGAKDLSAAELEQMGADMANLETTFGLDSDSVAQAVQSMLGSGLAEDWDDAVSTILAGYQTLGSSGDDFLDSLNEFSDDFARFGISGEEAVNLINQTLQNGAKDTDVLSDALNEVAIKLQDGTAEETLEKLGLDPSSMAAVIQEGGPGARAALGSVFDALQAEGSGADWAAIFGTKSEDYQNVFANIDFSSISDGLEQGIGDLEKFDEALNAGPAVSFETIKRTIEQLFTETLIPLIEMVNPPLQAMAEFLSENEWAAKGLAIVIGGALLAGVILITASLWSMAAAGWAAVAPWLPLIGMILLVVTAVVLLGYLIWQLAENWDEVVAWMGNTWASFTEWLSSSANAIGEGFQNIVKGIGNFFIGIINAVIDAINWMIKASNDLDWTLPEALGGATIGLPDIPTIPKVASLAKGAVVNPVPGGTLVRVAEAGRAEAVVDEGKLNTVLDGIINNGGNGSGVNISVYQQPGESTEELVTRIQEYFEMNSLASA